MEDNFGTSLKEVLKKMNITQEYAALKIGLSKGSMSQIINGPKNSKKKNTLPSYELLRKLCWILNFDQCDRELLFYKLYTEYDILPESIYKKSTYGKLILTVLKDNLLHGQDFYQNDVECTKELMIKLNTEIENHVNEKDEYEESQKEFCQKLRISDEKLQKCKVLPPSKDKPYTTISVL